jgi:glycosyltransferase involved in cell wall biosynthesis
VRRVVVIPNAVQRPLPELAPSVPPEAWVRDHERVVLAVGRLDAQKGFDVLVRAFARVRGQRPGWRLVLVGDGPERAALQALAASLGVQDAVAMPGRVGNVGRWLGRADVYVLSSRFEGFPNTLVEAMDAGIACIATDCETGPREIVRDGEDGLLVPVDDPRAMADALLALTGDGRRRAELGERARAVAERFDEARIEARWMDVLGALVPAGGAR